MNQYYYETDSSKGPIRIMASSNVEAVKNAQRFASLRGEKLVLVYNEAQDVLFIE